MPFAAVLLLVALAGLAPGLEPPPAAVALQEESGPADAEGPALAGSTEEERIRAVALDYIEGWYEADPERMERALHPHLAKRFLESLPDGSVRLTDTSALELVQQVERGGGSSVAEQERRTEVRVLDVFQDVASVRVDAHGWIDYMHLARANDEWRIVNVLWEIRQ